jgi:hypothetical protein
MKKLRMFGISVALVLSAIAVYCTYREHKLKTGFEATALGTTPNDLQARLGGPWQSTLCGTTFGGAVPRDCAREFVYASPMAPVLPEYWAFRYDKNDKLIDKYRYVSP